MSKVITMSFQEFFHKDEVQKINQLEQMAKKILNNKQLKKVAVIILGSLLYVQNVSAKGFDTKVIDSKGLLILTIFRSIGYWACIILCIVEILRAMMQGDTKSITKIISKYILIYASLFFLPWIFDFIKETFN